MSRSVRIAIAGLGITEQGRVYGTSAMGLRDLRLAAAMNLGGATAGTW